MVTATINDKLFLNKILLAKKTSKVKYIMYFSLVLTCLLAAAIADLSPDDVSYVFYNRQNFNGFFSRSFEDPSLRHLLKKFNSSLPTMLLIHGWQDNYESGSNTYVRDAILSKVDVNIIKVDWSPLSRQLYSAATEAVQPVAHVAASLLQRLAIQLKYPLRNVTLAGFSLGAHIAGNIGKALGGRIGVIVALDPAGPFISSDNADFSIHPTDAEYVQVIHTNGGLLGMIDPVGDADFYPNGGSRQPGCGLDLVGTCAHNRAWQFFAESVIYNNFLAVGCATWNDLTSRNCNGPTALMGGLQNIDSSAKGLFYLETNNASPFGRA